MCIDAVLCVCTCTVNCVSPCVCLWACEGSRCCNVRRYVCKPWLVSVQCVPGFWHGVFLPSPSIPSVVLTDSVLLCKHNAFTPCCDFIVCLAKGGFCYVHLRMCKSFQSVYTCSYHSLPTISHFPTFLHSILTLSLSPLPTLLPSPQLPPHTASPHSPHTHTPRSHSPHSLLTSSLSPLLHYPPSLHL